MIYEVTHLTRYRYDALVASNACMLRLLPHADAEQKVTDARLEIDPVPAGIVERADFLGNRLHLMRVETPHRELSIRSRSRVSVERPPPPP